jgi:hypothetical protein
MPDEKIVRVFDLLTEALILRLEHAAPSQISSG